MTFDLIVDASGRRGVLPGFRRREFCPKPAVAITANFVNQNTAEEQRVAEIPGVAALYSPRMFHDLRRATHMRLENLVYYKDRHTHYFVMTVNADTLKDKGIVHQLQPDTAALLAPENIDQDALEEAAREVAYYCTGYAVPSLQPASNHHGHPDVAIFEFASRQEAQHSCLLLQDGGQKLLMCLVGDSLLEPFWPEGTGIGRGFLSVLDAAWLFRSWSCGQPLETVIAERENLLTLLSNSTSQSLRPDRSKYTIDPHSRYKTVPTEAITIEQAKVLICTGTTLADGAEKTTDDRSTPGPQRWESRSRGLTRTKSTRKRTRLLRWYQRRLRGYRGHVQVRDLDDSWRNGMAYVCLLHSLLPHLINPEDVDPTNVEHNVNQVLSLIERHLGVTPPTSLCGSNMAAGSHVDLIIMSVFLSKLRDAILARDDHTASPDSSEDSSNGDGVSRMGLRRTGRALEGLEKPAAAGKRGEEGQQEGEEQVEEQGRLSVHELLQRFEVTSRPVNNVRSARQRRRTGSGLDGPAVLSPCATDQCEYRNDAGPPSGTPDCGSACLPQSDIDHVALTDSSAGGVAAPEETADDTEEDTDSPDHCQTGMLLKPARHSCNGDSDRLSQILSRRSALAHKMHQVLTNQT